MIRRPHQFTMLLTAEERAELQRQADEAGLTMADLIRLWLRGRAGQGSASHVGPKTVAT